MVVTLGQQYDVGEKPTIIMYAYINCHAGTPNKTETKDKMNLGTAQICYIGSRIGWVSAHNVTIANYRLTRPETISLPKRFDIFSHVTGEWSEGLDGFRFSFLFSSLDWAARSGARVQYLPKLKAVPGYDPVRIYHESTPNPTNLCTVQNVNPNQLCCSLDFTMTFQKNVVLVY